MIETKEKTSQGRVLVVDDEPSIVNTISDWLKFSGYETFIATTGAETLVQANKEKPDLIILDIILPDISGIEVLRKLKEIDPEVCVIFITAYASVETSIEALRLGADDYLMKPLSMEDMERVVEKNLKRRRTARELKEAQDELIRRSQRLASIGQLAAGVVHEIRGPLTGIRGTAELFIEKKKIDDPQVKKALKTIEKESKRALGIMERLLGFCRLGKPKIESVDINELVEETITLIDYEVYLHGAKIEKKLDENLPQIMGESDQLKQVFLNMVLNALQAMSFKKGILVIETTAVRDFIEVSFTDNGCGIPEENLKELFTLLDSEHLTGSTFKEDRKGTGLGLAVSYGIIKEHNGEINVKSRVDEGSTFTIRLPLKSHAILEVANG